MQKLTLYTNPHSRGGMVRWMLEECGADYDTVAVAFGAEIKAPAYRAINPLGKVPALAHGDTVLTETLAIITWLAEHYPDKALIPEAGSDARGEYYRWLCFALHLEYAAVDRWRGVENNAEQRKAIGYGDFDTAFAVLQERLRGREYLIGDRFSALDLYYSGLLPWLIHRVQVLPAESVYLDYMNRHLARPAHQRAIALDEALLAEMG
ncbi:glutathione S-transferase family protein [Cardiobacterium hominis]|uniref:glutathione S-transferase family protein n=1 Tax=Cardiobacterium hominis TaxID=2718 RepID=UPI0028E7AECD|nr:glutathione S-transferase family protein [Cardiobacterium hominis]